MSLLTILDDTLLLVGGVVRDYISLTLKNCTSSKIQSLSPSIYKVSFEDFLLYTLQVKDIDIATEMTPKQIASYLDSHGISNRIRKFATYTFEYYGYKIDITSNRIDTQCDGMRAKMKFGASYFQDSFRRDFTFNALYMNSNGIIFDFHNGIKHLINNEIHFIGNPKTRLIEDYTRIKRYYNFSQRFSMKNLLIEKEIDYIMKNSTTPIKMR